MGLLRLGLPPQNPTRYTRDSVPRPRQSMATDKASQILTAAEIFDLVRADLQGVEKAIDVEAVASVETVTTIGKYLQQSGGKRLRPALLLLCARFAGGGGKTAIQLGAVVEMLH